MSIECHTETSGKLIHTLTIDRHMLIADMPVASGGDDAGPGAHEYFDASLAACKGLTAMVYAKARNIALDRVRVQVERDASQEKQGRYLLKVKLAFEGALSAAEKAKLYEVLGRCPVHKLMTTTTVDIETAPLEP